MKRAVDEPPLRPNLILAISKNHQDSPMVSTNPALDTLGHNPLAAMQDLANRLRDEGGDLADFAIGDPDEPTPARIRDALVAATTAVSRYPTAVGQPKLRQAIAGWVSHRHGVEVDPDVNVLPSAGSKEAIFHLPFAVLQRGADADRVIWGRPGYPIYERGTHFAGGVSDPVTLTHDEGWRLELEGLSRQRLQRAAIAWVNYPHNPTGATVDLAYFRRQVATAREHSILLASDECYQELWFDAPAPSVLEAAPDLKGTLAFVSLSKRSGMTGYRSGAIIGDADLITLLRSMRADIGTASPDFVQAAAIAAWTDQDHVEERRAIFDAKRRVVLDFLDRAGLEVSGSEATFYLWFRAPDDDDAAYAAALLRERIVVTPGTAFGSAGAGWIRLALVPTVEECRAAVERWFDAIESGQLPR